MSTINNQLIEALKKAVPELFEEDKLNLDKLREQLHEESFIESEAKSKKYGLIWEDKPEQFEADSIGKLPVILKDKTRSFELNPLTATHSLIEGDNYHALKVLTYTHEKSIDVIYIDPPYNTGNEDFVFNDKIVDTEDNLRHSKWLSFMQKRLKLASRLLSDNGVMFISIDENERASLELLVGCYGYNSINLHYQGEIIWDKRSQKGGANGISTSHEHILVFSKNKSIEFKTVPKPNALKMINQAKKLFSKIGSDEIDKDLIELLKKQTGKTEKEIKAQYQEFKKIYTFEDCQRDFNAWCNAQGIPSSERAYNSIDPESGRLYRGTSLAKPDEYGYKYDIPHPTMQKPCLQPSNGWTMPKDTYEKWLADGIILFGKDESTQPEKKIYLDEHLEEKVKSIIQLSKGGTTDLQALGDNLHLKFSYPKPVALIKHLLSLFDNNITVLDFFAGSGTTGHAVAEMNSNDGGTRSCILVTNDEGIVFEDASVKKAAESKAKQEIKKLENSLKAAGQKLSKAEANGVKSKVLQSMALEGGICTHVTYPRMCKILKGGKNNKGVQYTGFGDNLVFYKTEFVAKDTSSIETAGKRFDLVKEQLLFKEKVYSEIIIKSNTISYAENDKKVVMFCFSGVQELELTLKSMKFESKDKIVYFCSPLTGVGDLESHGWILKTVPAEWSWLMESLK